jgi:hypothetical protein
VPLQDTLSRIVELSHSNVIISFNIQQIADIKINDVEVKVRGAKLPANHKVMPLYLSVTIRGGAEQLSDFSPDLISASVDFYQILQDTTGIIIPDIIIPNNLKLLNVDPPYVYHWQLKTSL